MAGGGGRQWIAFGESSPSDSSRTSCLRRIDRHPAHRTPSCRSALQPSRSTRAAVSSRSTTVRAGRVSSLPGSSSRRTEGTPCAARASDSARPTGPAPTTITGSTGRHLESVRTAPRTRTGRARDSERGWAAEGVWRRGQGARSQNVCNLLPVPASSDTGRRRGAVAGPPPPLGTPCDEMSDGAPVIDDERRRTDGLGCAPGRGALFLLLRRSHRSSQLAKDVSAKFRAM